MKLTGERSSVCAPTVKRRAPAYCGLICLLGCAATVAVNGAAPPLVPDAGEKPLHISNIVVFGDSYEDDGAVLRTSAAAVAAHIPHSTVLPAAPTEATYWNGRWSNGPTLVEVLARLLRVPLTNYAIGGAKSGSGNYYAWLDYFADTGISGQIDSFELTHAPNPDPDTLYIVSASTNDYGQFHDFHQSGRLPVGEAPALTYEALAEHTATNIRLDVNRLISLGARRIVVFAAYPLGQMPQSAIVDPQVAEAKRFATTFNRALSRQLGGVSTSDAHVAIFPIDQRMQSVIYHPARFGMSDVSHPCQATIPKVIPACNSPATFIWWDEVHPTAAMHEILGRMLRDSLGPPTSNKVPRR
jgi:phospholipase/lecithinase/hemolysin